MRNQNENPSFTRPRSFSLISLLDKCSSIFDNRPTRFARQVISDQKAAQKQIKVIRSNRGTYYSWSAE